MVFSNNRQQAILELLTQQRTVKAQEVVERFDVSIATAYRDLNYLVDSGLALKIQRGIMLASAKPTSGIQQGCCHCGQRISHRRSFILQLADGEQLTACCPHCGLLLLAQHPDSLAAMATDFLYSNKINVSQAFFLVNSSVTVCCSPSVLCFASQDEAERFCKGFGGEVLGYAAARDRIRAMMLLQPDHDSLF
jgi:DeoR/GlpR family transcriptional regulator of sugar metabolism